MATSKNSNPLFLVLGISAALVLAFFFFSGIYMLSGSWRSDSGSTGENPARFFKKNGGVGIVEINGVIMDSKKTLARLKKFDEDKGVKAVVLRLNSPGGSVAPSQEIYEAVKDFKKPVVASMASVAASGAYYIAVGAPIIYANPGTITGSIGVIMEFANLEKLYEWAKIKRYVIKTGKFKDAGGEHREMTPEDRALLQGMIDDVLVQFKTAVAAGRKLSLEDVTKVADGRIFSGNQAKNAKLVDELGTLDDAISHAATLAGIQGKPEVIYPSRGRPRWMDLLFDDGSGSGSDDSDSTTWLDRITSKMLPVRPLGFMPTPGIYWIWNGFATQSQTE
ncbi:MAG: signal peptide peptidase SppA [Bdellovibrionota bacterium]